MAEAEAQEYEFAARLNIRGTRYRGYGRTCETQLPISRRWTDCDFVACINVAGKFFYAYGNLHEAPFYPPDEPLSPSVRPNLIPESIRHVVRFAVEEASGFPSRIQSLIYEPALPRPRADLPFDSRRGGAVTAARDGPRADLPSDSRQGGAVAAARGGPRADLPSDSRRGGAVTAARDGPSTSSRSHDQIAEYPWWWGPIYAVEMGDAVIGIAFPSQLRGRSTRTDRPALEEPEADRVVEADAGIGLAFPSQLRGRSTRTDRPALEEPEADRVVEADAASEEGVGGAAVAAEIESLISKLRKRGRDFICMVRDNSPFKKRRME